MMSSGTSISAREVGPIGMPYDAAVADNRGLTIITHAIREASSAQEVYALLTTYLNGAQAGSDLKRRSQEVTAMQVVGMDDVKGCTLRLFSALQSVSESLDDNSRVAMKEALYVFGTALDHLGSYESGHPRPSESAPDSDHI